MGAGGLALCAGGRSRLPVDVPVPEQHGHDLRVRLHRGGDRRPGQPGRCGGRRAAARDRAQLCRRLPEQRCQPDRAGGPGHPRPGPDDPARRAVLGYPRTAGVSMRTLPRRLGIAVIVAVIVGLLSIKLDTFRDYQIAEVAVEVTAVAGLTVLTGLSGQISLGQGAFMAIGGYTTALA